jgi:hypothetical protein
VRAIGGPLSVGGETTYLEAHRFEANLTYRYLHADEIFKGDEYQPQYQQGGTNADITIHSWDLSLSYGLTKRVDLTLTLPFFYASADIVSNHFHQVSGGLGDLMFVPSAWIFNPDTHPNGNVSVGIGFRAPTGDSSVKDDQGRPIDPALLPGFGAWGVVAQLTAFQRLFDETYFYLGGSYVFSTVGETDISTPTNPNVHDSAPDSYQGRGGFTWYFLPSQGLSLSFGSMIEGVPVENVITGADYGFRRPGYAIYVEPGIAWSVHSTVLSLSGPVAVYRTRLPSTRDEAMNVPGVGALANYQIIFSISHFF